MKNVTTTRNIFILAFCDSPETDGEPGGGPHPDQSPHRQYGGAGEGAAPGQVGCQVRLQGWEVGSMSWGRISAGHPKGTHLCRNLCTEPLISK